MKSQVWGSLTLAQLYTEKCRVEVTSVGLAHARPITAYEQTCAVRCRRAVAVMEVESVEIVPVPRREDIVQTVCHLGEAAARTCRLSQPIDIASPAIQPVQDLPTPPTVDTSQRLPSPAHVSDPIVVPTLMSLPNDSASSGPPLSPIIAHPLPPPTPLASPSFVWGQHDAETFTHSVTAAFTEVVHWRKTPFLFPTAMPGKSLCWS